MANPHPSQELASVAVVVHEDTEPIMFISAYVTLCGVVNMGVNTAFEDILSYRV